MQQVNQCLSLISRSGRHLTASPIKLGHTTLAFFAKPAKLLMAFRFT